MAFKLISTIAGDRQKETHCDDTMHIVLTLPLNRYSGEQTGIQVFGCTCQKPDAPKAKKS